MQRLGDLQQIQEKFLQTGNGAAAQQELTRAKDEVAIAAYRAAIEPVLPQSAAILAIGDYARAAALPFSELEILVLLESHELAETLRLVQPEFGRLLGESAPRVKYSIRTVASVESPDLVHRRLLAGDASLVARFESRLKPSLIANAGESRERHVRFHNTVRHSRPDLFFGPGGWLDLRLLESMRALQPDREQSEPDWRNAAALLSTMILFLQYRSGGTTSVLDFAAQQALAEQPFARGRSCADWMRDYFEAARILFGAARRAIDTPAKTQNSLLESLRDYRARLSNQEFTVSRDRVLLRNPAQLAADPALALRAVEFVGRHGIPPAADTERRFEAARAGLPTSWPELRGVLSTSHVGLALRTLDATGLLTAVLPEWTAIGSLVPDESHAKFTRGEDALQAIERVASLHSCADPALQHFCGVLSEVEDCGVLMFALLFQADPAAAREAMTRIQTTVEDAALVEFLLAGPPDFGAEISPRQLAAHTGTVERLRLLTLMAYANLPAEMLDQLWNAYSATRHELMCELETDRIQDAPTGLPGNAAFVKGFPLRYLRARSAQEIESDLRLFELSRPTGVAVRIEPAGDDYRLTIVARDRPFLFASFAGAMSKFGLNILKAEAFSNAGGHVLDTFVLADPKRLLQKPGESDRLIDAMQRIALGKPDAQRLLPARSVSFSKRAAHAEVQFDSEACPSATLVEVIGEDRPGLLYSLASVFSSNSCNIDVVLVDTKGHRAIDVFYVAYEGRKLSPAMQASLKEKLLAAC